MCVYVGFDIMGVLVFGSDFATVQEEKYRALADSILPASMVMYWVRMSRVFVEAANCRSDIIPASGRPGASTPAYKVV